MREASEIRGYHAHIYSDPATREHAALLREELPKHFTGALGRWHDGAYGPHPKSAYPFAFACDEFATVVPWLMLNRGALSILVHPCTGDEIADHSTNPLWLGEPLPIDLEFLRQHA